MRDFHQFLNDLLLISLLLSAHAKEYSPICPNGFHMVYDEVQQRYICFQLKGPETFRDKYRDCSKNLYTTELFQRLNILKNSSKLWTDFRSFYYGGPFVEQKYSKDKANVIFNTTNIRFIDNSTELCLITDGTGYAAVDCENTYKRYCFVSPIESNIKVNKEPDGLSYEFQSPHEINIVQMRTKTKLTWREAKALCEGKQTRMLSKGWVYMNSDHFSESSIYPVDGRYITKLSTKDDAAEKNEKGHEIFSKKWVYAVKNKFLGRVDDALTYDEILCERDILTNTVLDLGVNELNKIVLAIDTFSKDDIYCYTDSVTYYPTYVEISPVKDTKKLFELSPLDDGYYWCVHYPLLSEPTASNRVLYIKSEDALWNLHAVKMRVKEYDIDNVNKTKYYLKEQLEEYINQTRSHKSEKNVKADSNTRVLYHIADEDMIFNDTDLIVDLKVKRLYLDRRTVLVHVSLVDWDLLKPGIWGNLEILSVRRVIYCKDDQRLAFQAKRGYQKCVGDFNEGMEWRQHREYEHEGFILVENITKTVVSDLTSENAERMDVKNKNGHIGPIATELPTYTAITESEILCYTTTTPLTTPETTTILSTASTTVLSTETTTVLSTETTTTTECTETTTDPEGCSTIVPTLPTSTVTTQIPEELIQMILEDLELILQDENAPITIGDIRDIFAQVNTLLSILPEGGDVYVPSQLLQLIDELSLRISLGDESKAVVVESNIAMLMVDSSPSYPVLGVTVTNINPDHFMPESFEFYTDYLEQLPSNVTEAGVFLPLSLRAANTRISFVVYRDGRAFSSNSPVVANSRVISVNVKDFAGFQSGEYINIHTSPMIPDPGRNITRSCGYWKFVQLGPDYWSQDGCSFIRTEAENVLDICRCDHLTHFAEILIPRPLFSQINENILKVISILGSLLSILGLSIIILTSLIIESWRTNFRNQIWLQMCIAIFIMMICYIIVVFANFEYNTTSCMVVGVLLHYSLLASFCWMLVVATKSYRDLVLIFSQPMSHKLLIGSLFSWGLPALVIVVLISWSGSYSDRFSDMNPNSNFCYPSGLGLWLSVYFPVSLILTVNLVLFISIVRNIGIAPKNLRYQRAGDRREALSCARVSLVLVIFFGLPWFLGLFAHNIVAAYLFTITATSQGFVLFVFIVFGNQDTRTMWLLKLRSRNRFNNNTSGKSVTMF